MDSYSLAYTAASRHDVDRRHGDLFEYRWEHASDNGERVRATYDRALLDTLTFLAIQAGVEHALGDRERARGAAPPSSAGSSTAGSNWTASSGPPSSKASASSSRCSTSRTWPECLSATAATAGAVPR